jgi:crotonobetainyl-CoA:carnitine CoA-transferase CaiB-like acyl-CoA transferase
MRIPSGPINDISQVFKAPQLKVRGVKGRVNRRPTA